MENLSTESAEGFDLASNKPPAFQVFARDEYLKSMHLTAEEFAAHWRATLWSWTEGPLPVDEAQRARICVVKNTRRFRKVWAAIAPLWSEGPSGYTSHTLEERRAEQDRYLALQREKAAAGGRAKAAARGQDTGGHEEQQRLEIRVPAPVPAATPRETPRTWPERASSSASSSSEDQRQEQPPAALSEGEMARVNMAVLTRLAHDVWSDLDAYPDDAPEIQPGNIGPEAAERLKVMGSKHGLEYDAGAIARALDSAQWQRSHETPVEAGERLSRQALAGQTDWTLREVFNADVYRAVGRSRPHPRDQEWRDKVCSLVFRDTFLRSLPAVFELQFAPDSSVSRLRLKR